MLLRSRCGENCRCEKEHNTDSLRRTKPRGSSRHLRSGGNLSVSEQSNIRETISTVHTKTNSITFSPLEFSTPIRPQGVPWVATAERTTLPSATATDLSLLSLGSSRTAKAQQQPVGILKWTEEEGGTELQSTKQVRFGNCILQNGGTHHGTLYSDSEESVDGEERGAGNSSWQHRLQQQQQQQQGIPNGLSKGQDPAQTVTTTTTTTTETVMTDMPREEVFSDTDDEVFATEQQSRGGWGPQQRAVYLVPSDNGASPSFWGAALHRQQLRQQHQQDEREGRRQALLAAMAREADERYVAQHQRPLLIRAILGLFVGLWKLVYIATAGYIVADAWVLSRVSQQRRKRLTVALFFLIMVPLLLWLLHEEQGVANVCIQSAGSHVYEVVSEAAKSLGMATAYLSAPLSWLSWPFSGSPSTAPPPPVAPVVLQANHVTVGKQVPEPQLLSEQRLEDLVQKVLKRLSLQAPSDDRAAGKTKEDLERLRQELEAHKTTVEQLLLRVGDLKDCCRDTATLLAGLDSKIVARVLEVMNDSSSEMAPRSVLHRWLTEEMDRREAIFGASVDVRLGEHRDSVQAAVNTASQQVAQVQRVAMEAHRKAEEAIMEARRAPAVVAEMTRPDAPAMNDVTRVVKEMLAKYDADKTGLPDYALESAGGSVVNTRCTETYSNGGRRYYMFGLPIWTFTRSPRDAITPGMHPGECWAFRGSQGHLVIKLSQRIRVTAISVEHIARSLVSSGHTSSAPRDFQIWGLESETDSSGRLLGSYTYDADGDTLQYFIVQTPEPAIYDYVEMKILSNHGNLDYTCLYRLRVHGEPAS
ncbi:uncharacterized protein LOC144101785 isoform X2 [Amblyomma americanum]